MKILPVLGLALLAVSTAAADSHKTPPPPPATAADVAALRDAVGALAKGPLHDIADAQAAANARIDSLSAAVARTARDLGGVDLAQLARDTAATRGAVAGVLSEQAGVARQVSGLDARLQAARDEMDAERKELARQVAAEQERLARFQQESRQSQEVWQREAGAGTAAALTAQAGATRERFRTMLWVVLAIGIAGAAVTALQIRARRRAQRDLLLTLSRLGADLRQNLPRGGATASPGPAGWEDLERRLRLLTERWEARASAEHLLADGRYWPDGLLAPEKGRIADNSAAGGIVGDVRAPSGNDGSPGALNAREGSLGGDGGLSQGSNGADAGAAEHGHVNGAAGANRFGEAKRAGHSANAADGANGADPTPSSFPSRTAMRPFPGASGLSHRTGSTDRPTVSIGGLAEPSVASRLLWPAEFLDPESPLSRWRFLLESHFEDPSRPALPVLGCLLGLRAVLARPSPAPAEIASGAFRLSEALHAYWQSLPELSADDCQQASAAWLQSVRALIGAAAPRLELREILPEARIDLDLMHPVREGPGNHLNVAGVFSWAVLDRSAGDRPRVLHRALVASS